jgi:hypothetical protein
MKAESKLNLPLSVPDTVIAVLGYACLNYVQIPLNLTAEQETFKWLVSIAGGLLFCGFLAGRIWREFVSSRSKLAADDMRMRSHDKRLRALEMERAALRATFVALLGRFDIEKTRLSQINAEIARYNVDEDPTDDGTGSS